MRALGTALAVLCACSEQVSGVPGADGGANGDEDGGTALVRRELAG